MVSLGAKGPFFVSIGDAAKLRKFLEINPSVPKDQAFVDDYNLQAYTKAGFGKLELGTKLPNDVSVQAPSGFGWKGWWTYLKNVVSVSPAPSKTVTSQQVLESVSRLGGTFIVNGDEVVYQWKDRIPGDTPDLDQVLDAVKNA